MRSIVESMKTGWPMLLSVIVVVLVLHGCTTPLVDVKVVTCGQNTTGDNDGPGACNPQTITAAMMPVNPVICKQNGATVDCGANTCAVGTTRCTPTSPGTGCGRKACKTMLQLPGTTCYCDCSY